MLFHLSNADLIPLTFSGLITHIKRYTIDLYKAMLAEPGPYDHVEEIARLEHRVRAVLAFHHGFDCIHTSPKQLYSEMIGLYTFLIIGVFRFTFLLLINNSTGNFIFGDLMTGSPYRFIVYLVYATASQITLMFKIVAFWLEITDRIKFIRILNTIKHKGFGERHTRLRKKERQYFQKLTVLMARTCDFSIIAGFFGVLLVYFYLVLTNLDNIQVGWSLGPQIFWVLMMIPAIYLKISICFYGVLIGYLINTYIKLRQDGILRFLDKVKNKRNAPPKMICTVLADLIEIIDFFEQYNKGSKVLYFIIVIPVTLILDGFFFLGAIYGTETFLLNLGLVIACGTVLGGITIAFFVCSLMKSEGDMIAKYFYGITMKSSISGRLKFQVLYLLERMQATPCCILVGDLFYMSMDVAILYLLENASNIMLFTINFQKSR